MVLIIGRSAGRPGVADLGLAGQGIGAGNLNLQLANGVQVLFELALVVGAQP